MLTIVDVNMKHVLLTVEGLHYQVAIVISNCSQLHYHSYVAHVLKHIYLTFLNHIISVYVKE